MSRRKEESIKGFSASIEDSAYQRTLDHAKAGYENAQASIKFVDTKCSVLIALSTSVAGFSVALVRWNFESPLGACFAASRQACTWWFLGAFLLFSVSLLACVFCITATIWTLIARPAPAGAFSVLFPVPPNSDKPAHTAWMANALLGMDGTSILREYQEQLGAVGLILKTKIRHSRFAAIALLVQLFSVVIAILIYFAAVASSL